MKNYLFSLKTLLEKVFQLFLIVLYVDDITIKIYQIRQPENCETKKKTIT